MYNHSSANVDLSVIIVTWNVWPLLRACLHSLQATTAADPVQSTIRHFGPPDAARTLEVIVVDNAGHDETSSLLPTEFPWVRFLRSEQNTGFTGGNNLGYSLSRGEMIFSSTPIRRSLRKRQQLAHQWPRLRR